MPWRPTTDGTGRGCGGGWRGVPRRSARTLALTLGGLLLLVDPGAGPGRHRAAARAGRGAGACPTCELAGVGARDEIRRYSEDALTSARLLASRPTLLRLVRAGQPEPLEFFVRRFCETGRPRRLRRASTGDACSPPPRAVPLGRAGRAGRRSRASASCVAPPSAPDGLLGATGRVAGAARHARRRAALLRPPPGCATRRARRRRGPPACGCPTGSRPSSRISRNCTARP